MTAEELLQAINERFDRIEKMALLGSKNVLTLDEVAIVTGLKKGYIYRLTSEQKIPHYKPGGRVYFKKDEVEEWLLQNRVATLSEIDSKATTYCTTRKK